MCREADLVGFNMAWRVTTTLHGAAALVHPIERRCLFPSDGSPTLPRAPRPISGHAYGSIEAYFIAAGTYRYEAEDVEMEKSIIDLCTPGCFLGSRRGYIGLVAPRRVHPA